MPTNQDVLSQLLKRTSLISSKDGSQGLDVLASLHQYIKAYNLVHKHIPKGSIVLDWGGGSGHFSFFLNLAGYQTQIYAFAEPQLIQPEVADGKIVFVKANINESVHIPLADYSFDAICSIGVLEHVREIGGNERASLKEISRLLKPGGKFLCYHFPSKSSWIEFLACRFGSYHHQYTYDKDMIDAIFHNILRVEHCKRYAFLPRNSLRHLPKWLANNRWFARCFDALDSILCRLFPWVSQNWLIIAVKPMDPDTTK